MTRANPEMLHCSKMALNPSVSVFFGYAKFTTTLCADVF